MHAVARALHVHKIAVQAFGVGFELVLFILLEGARASTGLSFLCVDV